MEETTKKTTREDQEGTATHSGWNYFYPLFSKYRDECLKLGQVVLGTSQDDAMAYLKQYVSSLYSMAQQIFSFYNEEKEKALTLEWLKLLEEAGNAIYLYEDPDFRKQSSNEGNDFLSKELRLKLMMFFNKINRLAAEAGLLVGKENKDLDEPKKGLLGL